MLLWCFFHPGGTLEKALGKNGIDGFPARQVSAGWRSRYLEAVCLSHSVEGTPSPGLRSGGSDPGCNSTPTSPSCPTPTLWLKLPSPFSVPRSQSCASGSLRAALFEISEVSASQQGLLRWGCSVSPHCPRKLWAECCRVAELQCPGVPEFTDVFWFSRGLCVVTSPPGILLCPSSTVLSGAWKCSVPSDHTSVYWGRRDGLLPQVN